MASSRRRWAGGWSLSTTTVAPREGFGEGRVRATVKGHKRCGAWRERSPSLLEPCCTTLLFSDFLKNTQPRFVSETSYLCDAGQHLVCVWPQKKPRMSKNSAAGTTILTSLIVFPKKNTWQAPDTQQPTHHPTHCNPNPNPDPNPNTTPKSNLMTPTLNPTIRKGRFQSQSLYIVHFPAQMQSSGENQKPPATLRNDRACPITGVTVAITRALVGTARIPMLFQDRRGVGGAGATSNE